MGKTYDQIDDKLAGFIAAQKMFFVATAPLSGEGHVNLSPKGYDSFRIVDPVTVAYADLGGSGIETVAHIRENGRITVMFCAFEGPANILRLYGTGRVMQFDHPAFQAELAKFPPGHERARNIVFIDVHRIADSCGWGVPFYEFKGERDQLTRYVGNLDLDEWYKSRLARNAVSLDGLPGLVPHGAVS
ncbi:pyridoxamine 5'-phosphate oxidase family protein [bacterium]|nr:pyridoxamine 5'-phosphate oxidase family protein [bacterium]